MKDGRMGIQAKSKISQPGDTYEQEADMVAEEVMRISATNSNVSTISPKESEGIASKSEPCEMTEKETGELNICRKSSLAAYNLEVNDQIIDEIEAAKSGAGSPLDYSTKEFMESRFGYDFRKVRIHTDEKSCQISLLS